MSKCQYCGKEISARGLRMHEQHCSLKNKTDTGKFEDVQEKRTTMNNKKDSENQVSEVQGRTKFQEVNLMEEYNKNKNQVEKTESKAASSTNEQEDNYQCGACQATFYRKTKPKFCPECGVEF